MSDKKIKLLKDIVKKLDDHSKKLTILHMQQSELIETVKTLTSKVYAVQASFSD